MRDERANPENMRLTLLRRYSRALDQGDIETVATLLRRAETDATLERMFVAANETDAANAASTDSQAVALSAPGEDHAMKPSISRATTVSPRATAPRSGAQVNNDRRIGAHPPAMQRGQAVRRMLRPVNRFAAVAVIAALVIGILGLLVSRGDLGSLLGKRHPTPTPTGPQVSLGSIIVVGGQDGAVRALHAGSGAPLWQWGSAQSIDSLASSESAVYVASHPKVTQVGLTLLTALRASDGARLWQTTKPQITGYTYMIDDGETLMVASNYGDGTVYALDARTGRTRWTYANDSGREDILISVGHGVVYMDGVTQGFTAVDEQTGKLLWTYNDGLGTASVGDNNNPSVLPASGGLIYYNLAGTIYGNVTTTSPSLEVLSAASGKVQRRYTVSQVGLPSLVTPDGFAYTGVQSGGHGKLCSVRISNAQQLWCANTLDPITNIFLLVATPSQLLYAYLMPAGPNAGDVEVGALNRTTGAPMWSWQGDANLSPYSNSVKLSGNQRTLNVTTTHGLYTFQPATGHLLDHALATTDISLIQPVFTGPLAQ